MDNKFCYWQFVEKNHPAYFTDDRVLQVDILYRYIDNDEVSENDIKWINSIGSDSDIKRELIHLETSLFSEALENFYNNSLVHHEATTT